MFSTGISAQPGSLSLAITQKLDSGGEDEKFIEATFSWKKAGMGHGALVGCYSGPGDSNLYACRLEAATADSPQISLYVNDGAWKVISEWKAIPKSEINTSSGGYSVRVSLSIFITEVIVKVGSTTLICTENTQLTRTSIFGIRACENQFTISQIITGKRQKAT